MMKEKRFHWGKKWSIYILYIQIMDIYLWNVWHVSIYIVVSWLRHSGTLFFNNWPSFKILCLLPAKTGSDLRKMTKTSAYNHATPSNLWCKHVLFTNQNMNDCGLFLCTCVGFYHTCTDNITLAPIFGVIFLPLPTTAWRLTSHLTITITKANVFSRIQIFTPLYAVAKLHL